ncbi:MAG: MBL fold metallo-hydrolase [Bryobacterales bacterium]|jgi:glyoxylase-like metal-dependent hydrolase (beta-lactamase superfamily II)|nr:MBL fold metallo-hydrolase [Bryobacterales bacterium]
MFHRVFTLGQLQCNASLLGDEETREAVVIDPGEQPRALIDAIRDGEWRVKEILFTHAHIDHVAGALEVQQLTGAPVAMHPADLGLYDSLAEQAAWIGMPTPPRVEIAHWLEEGEVLECGSVRLKVLFTPGHAPGHVSFYLADQAMIVSADVLFRASIGRTDLPGGNHSQLLESIRTQLLVLPDETRVIPGHGPATTIGLERRTNPFLAD